MVPKNKDEKRRSRQRMKARKRQERAEFREKYKTWNQQEDELTDYNLKLESGVEKAKFLSFISILCTFAMFAFSVFSVALLNSSILLNSILLILYAVSVFITLLLHTNYMNRCQFFISLAERPSVPTRVCIPKYMVDWDNRYTMEDTFENINKDDIFKHCSAKRVVITNNSGSLVWVVPFIMFLIFLYILFDMDNKLELFMTLLFSLTALIITGFLYAYNKKNVFIIDREKKTISVPSLSRFGRNKVLPYQQVVVAFHPGTISFSRSRGCMIVTHDYISLTAKEDLPFGSKVGFRCDSYTQYRFALFICEYMNVPDLNDMPYIEGFEDIISKIKAK